MEEGNNKDQKLTAEASRQLFPGEKPLKFTKFTFVQ